MKLRKMRPSAYPVSFPNDFARSIVIMNMMTMFTIGTKYRTTHQAGLPTISSKTMML